MTMVNLSSIVIDETVWRRNGISSSHVSQLADALDSGAILPAIVIDQDNILVDGRHRYEAHKRVKRNEIDVIVRNYANPIDRFIDAVEANIEHGMPLDSYDKRRAIISAIEFGINDATIASFMRCTVTRVQAIKQGFAFTGKDSEPVALKRGISHLAGTKISHKQKQAIEHYSGSEGTFHARQLTLMLKNELFRKTPQFIESMNELMQIWENIKDEVA